MFALVFISLPLYTLRPLISLLALCGSSAQLQSFLRSSVRVIGSHVIIVMPGRQFIVPVRRNVGAGRTYQVEHVALFAVDFETILIV